VDPVSASAFRKGTLVAIDSTNYALIRLLDKQKWQLEERDSGRIVIHTDQDLRNLYAESRLRFARSNFEPDSRRPRALLADFEPQLWEEAKVKRAYVTATLDLPGTRSLLTPVIRDTWVRLGSIDRPPHVASVLRWRKKFLESGSDIQSLIDRHDRKGNFESRYPEEVEEIVQTAIDSKYMTEERGTMQDVIDEAQALVILENNLRPASLKLPRPARRLISRLLREIPAFDKHAARYGKESALRRYRSVLKHGDKIAALDTAVFDHSLLNVMVIDDATGLPLGRPWLTVGMDDGTRNCLGFFISFEPPSYHTVAKCLRHAIMPKLPIESIFIESNNAWEPHGIMRNILVDNGPEFHSASLENACLSLNIEIHYCPRKKPWFKGKIERFIGSMLRALSIGIPGVTFANIFEKEDYDPSKHAIISLRALREIAHKWIVDVYHQKRHRTLQATPASVWASSVNPSDILLPNDPAKFDAIMGESITRCLTHKGIELDSLFYNSHELTALRRRYGSDLDVEVRRDRQDLGQIVVLSPNGHDMVVVPALDSKYANGLSEWQHRVCKRHARRLQADCSPDGWLLAKHDISRLIDEEFKRKGRKSRARIARFRGESHEPEQPVSASHPQPIQSVPDISGQEENHPETSITVDEAPDFHSTSELTTADRSRRVYKPLLRDRGESSQSSEAP
jgi:putative transposase